MPAKHQPRNTRFKVDVLLDILGHQALRLPPHNPDLNPIEFVWGATTGQVGKGKIKIATTYQRLFILFSMFFHSINTFQYTRIILVTQIFFNV